MGFVVFGVFLGWAGAFLSNVSVSGLICHFWSDLACLGVNYTCFVSGLH